MGDAYWEWEENGESGFANIAKMLQPIIDYYTLPASQQGATLRPAFLTPKTKAKKPPRPVENSEITDAVAQLIMEWRYKGRGFAQIAESLSSLGIAIPSVAIWDERSTEAFFGGFLSADAVTS